MGDPRRTAWHSTSQTGSRAATPAAKLRALPRIAAAWPCPFVNCFCKYAGELNVNLPSLVESSFEKEVMASNVINLFISILFRSDRISSVYIVSKLVVSNQTPNCKIFILL